MTTTPNFASILDEAPSEVRVPLPLPTGTYLATVKGLPEYGVTPKSGTKFIKFTLGLVYAEDDVDPDALEEVGGLEGKTLTATYWETPNAIFMLDQFHQDCGIDLSEPATRRQRNEAVMNAQVRVYIKHTPSRDGKRIMAEIANTMPAE